MNKEEFNIEEWLNKKPDTTSLKNTDQKRSTQIREIHGASSPKSVDCCPLSVDSNQSVEICEICGIFSDLQHEIELLTVEIENRAIDIAPDYQSWRDLGLRSQIPNLSRADADF